MTSLQSVLWILIALLSGIGWLISFYMTLGYYRVQPLFSWLSRYAPASCGPDSALCTTILVHPSANLFRFPNAFYGMIYYLLVVIALLTRSWVLLWICRWASVVTLMMSAYLTYILSRRLKSSCVLCYSAHVINGVLAAILWDIPDF